MFTDVNLELKRIYGKFDDNMINVVVNLNYWLKNKHIQLLRHILDEVSYGGDNIGFLFPSGVEPGDEEYFEEGVLFNWGILSVIVDNQTFYKYLKKAVDDFVVRYPDNKNEAEEIMLKIKTKYNCTDDPSVDRVLKTIVLDY